MGKSKVRMIIQDIAVQGDQCVISVKIRYGSHSWDRGFRLNKEALADFNLDILQKRVWDTAQQLIKDQQYLDLAVQKLEDMKGKEITISPATKIPE